MYKQKTQHCPVTKTYITMSLCPSLGQAERRIKTFFPIQIVLFSRLLQYIKIQFGLKISSSILIPTSKLFSFHKIVQWQIHQKPGKGGIFKVSVTEKIPNKYHKPKLIYVECFVSYILSFFKCLFWLLYNFHYVIDRQTVRQ